MFGGQSVHVVLVHAGGQGQKQRLANRLLHFVRETQGAPGGQHYQVKGHRQRPHPGRFTSQHLNECPRRFILGLLTNV